MANIKSKAEARLDRVFGIKDTAPEHDRAAYDYSIHSLSNADIYIEDEPTVKEYFQEIIPSLKDVRDYIARLFPFRSWIGKYNLTWALGDLIAGKSLPPGL